MIFEVRALKTRERSLYVNRTARSKCTSLRSLHLTVVDGIVLHRAPLDFVPPSFHVQ